MINQNRYVNIISGVGAGATVAQRQLIMRLITQSSTIPTGIVAEFASADAVGAYFGTQTEEYRRAQAYFSFISKAIRSPGLISFSRWVSGPVAPVVVGDSAAKNLADFKSIASGSIQFFVDGVSVVISGIDLSAVDTFAQVATTLQTSIRAGTTNPQLVSASVAYNAVTQQFTLTGTVTGSGLIEVGKINTGVDLGTTLGWNTTGATFSSGQAADTAADAVRKSANISNNFGSFAFTTPSVALTNQNIAEVAAWNHSQNNMYMYLVPTILGNMATLYALVKGYSGCDLTLVSQAAADYSEQCAGEILAATNYEDANATQNFMFYQFANRAVTVSDDDVADTCDLNRTNYIGVTQSAGQPLAFFQRGILCGGSQDAVDMNTYANEMWLKSAMSAKILQLFLNQPSVSTDLDGQASLLGVIQDVIDSAKTNGTFANGKTLDVTQQQYITQITNDPVAWRQVSTLGYWVSINVSSTVKPNGIKEFVSNYTLIYAKDDQIRAVTGRDILI